MGRFAWAARIPVDSAGTTRRTVLSRGSAVVAGALGASVLGANVALGAKQAGAPPDDSHCSCATCGSASVRARAGALHERRAPASPHGALVDAAGQTVGSFSAGVLAGSGGGISVQRFNLADGTIIGMGSGGLQGAEYAIVGGTGRYAGATGTYTTQLAAGARGRDAAFQISLTGTKG